MLVMVVGFFSPPSIAHGQAAVCVQVMGPTGVTTNYPCTDPTTGQLRTSADSYKSGSSILSPTFWFWKIMQAIAALILRIAALVLYIGGAILNLVLNYTILGMSENLKSLGGINVAWKVIRDIMNIAFIFLLVYEGILMIIGQSSIEKVRKFVVGIVLASLLINFSLFFTKVLIDASNIVTIGLYNSIIDTSTASIPGQSVTITGLSVPFMNRLGLSAIFSASSFDAVDVGGEGNLVLFNLMGAVLFVIVAFVFFAVAMMFIVRYVTLLILLMLSPVAYMGMALPFMGQYASQWWKALNSQLIFAPVYMLMTWVVLTLMGSEGTISNGSWGSLVNGSSGGAANSSSLNLLFNYAVIICLAIASLIIAKKTSTQGSSYIKDATDKLTTTAGNTLMGGSAWAARKSLGNISNRVASNADLQEAAATKTGLSGAWARSKLYVAKSGRDSTFDVRNATIPTNVMGDMVEGTLGRTTRGKALGLNDLNIPSVAAGAPLSKFAGTGQGGTKGYRDISKESAERVRTREAAASAELAIATAKRDVLAGKNAAKGTADYDKMEQAIAKLSDKQTETLVAGNRDLLESLNFANMISVKQLESLNKSDLLSDAEKGLLKNTRFTEINNGMDALKVPAPTRTPAQNAAVAALPDEIRNNLADSELEMINPDYLKDRGFVKELRSNQVEAIMKSAKFSTSQKEAFKTQRFADITDATNLAALATPATTRTPAQVTQAGVISGAIKNLSDGELDMIDPTLLARPEVVAQLKAGQIEAINKSNKLSTPIKDAFRTALREPLMNALRTGNSADIQAIIKKTDAKTLVTYLNIPGRGTTTIAFDPDALPMYTPQKLKQMALIMTDDDISKLRAALEINGNNNVKTWLADPNKGGSDFA